MTPWSTRLVFLFAVVAYTLASPEGDRHIVETREAMRGELFAKGDERYEEARSTLLFNRDLNLENEPALIAQVLGQNDVRLSLGLAKMLGLSVSVRSGGHRIRGSSTNKGGVVVDLRRMRSVRVHERERYVWVEGGATLHDVDSETHPRGLATPTGTVSCTGIGGLTTGGGWGWLSRKYGFAVDNVLEVEMVTADGTFVVASSKENTDLFWAVRGGGGSFGIVTAFKLQLHPLPEKVLGGTATFDIQHFRSVTEAVGRWYEAGPPPEVGLGLFTMQIGSSRMVRLLVSYAGDPEDGHRVFQPLLEAAPVATYEIEETTFSKTQTLDDVLCSAKLGQYWTSIAFKRSILFSEEGLKYLLEVEDACPHGSIIYVEGWDGMNEAGMNVTAAAGREAATAFDNRKAEVNLLLLGMFDPLDMAQREATIAWVQETKMKGAALTDLKHEYSNYASFGDTLQGNSNEHIQKLRKVKAKWDPDNVFSRAHLHITPLGFADDEM